MTGRLWLISLLVLFFSFLGLATVKGALLALALPLLVYLGAAILLMPSEIDLELHRSLSARRVTHGSPVTIEISITNQGHSLEEVLLEDRLSILPENIQGELRRMVRFPKGQTLEWSYTAHPKRGRYRLEGIRATASDPFGLFQRHRMLSEPGEFLVYPQVIELRSIQIAPRQTHGFAGPIPAHKPGSGVDFYGVRQYQLGDALRRINWRVSARHERGLYTNEFEQDSIADVGIILDSRQQSHIVTDQGALFEYSVLAAASLASTFLHEGHRVGLLVYGASLDRTFPGYGRHQRERILRSLARAQTGLSFVLESLSRLPTRFFPSRSQLVMVSPLMMSDLSVLLRLRANGYSLLIVSPDLVEFESRSFNAGTVANFPTRLARIERVLLLRKLRHAGIQVVDWPVHQPLSSVIHASLLRSSAPHSLNRIPL